MKNHRMNTALPLLIGAALTVGVAGSARAEWVDTGSHSFPRLCPQKIGGDREYAGHGPEVSATIELYTEADGQEL